MYFFPLIDFLGEKWKEEAFAIYSFKQLKCMNFKDFSRKITD